MRGRGTNHVSGPTPSHLRHRACVGLLDRRIPVFVGTPKEMQEVDASGPPGSRWVAPKICATGAMAVACTPAGFFSSGKECSFSGWGGGASCLPAYWL